MANGSISRSDLYKRVVRAAQVRSGITLLSAIACLVATAVIHGLAQLPDLGTAIVFLGMFFGLPMVISRIVTERVCKRMVTCPVCGSSLWCCGTGNFKPRRMRIRDGVTQCPYCNIPIV